MSGSRSPMRAVLCLLLCTSARCTLGQPYQSLFQKNAGAHHALLVGVSHGLPGIGADVQNLKTLFSPYFDVVTLQNEAATKQDVQGRLTELSAATDEDGTLLFYFSGHGEFQLLNLQDEGLSLGELREAMQRGRAGQLPLKQLIVFLDACHSGSFVQPFGSFTLSNFVATWASRPTARMLVDHVFSNLSQEQEETPRLWEKLFIFASSRSDEESKSSPDGSGFSRALEQAFSEVRGEKGTVQNFVYRTKYYTQVQNPIERLAPRSLGQEALVEETDLQ